MKFTFRLQTLHRLRLADREQCQLRLSEAERADEILRARLADVAAELTDAEQAIRDAAQPGVVDVDRVLGTQRYELVLGVRRAELKSQRERLAIEIERRRHALVESDRGVKVLEKLRDKQHLDFVLREQKLDVKRLDEIAQRRTTRGPTR